MIFPLKKDRKPIPGLLRKTGASRACVVALRSA